MDPNATWENLLEALTEGDWHEAFESAEALLDWLDRGGFPPEPARKWLGDSDAIRVACRFARELARRNGGNC